MNDKLLRNFMHDTRTFLDRLGAQLIQLEKNPDNMEILEQCFRTAHSLKSEASYMDYEGMARTAHNLESRLEELRTGGMDFSPAMMDEMLGWLDSLEEQSLLISAGSGDIPDDQPVDSDPYEVLQTLPEGSVAEPEPPENPVVVPDLESPNEPEIAPEHLESLSDRKRSAESVKDSGIFDLNEFQRTILSEAKERGELFYRLICELDPETPMKYAKAYLLVNNLELIVNVLGVTPSMDDPEADFTELNILFTSAVSEGEIFRAVNVDQVDRIQLAGLSFDISPSADDSEGALSAGDSDDDKNSREAAERQPEVEIRISSEVLEKLNSLIEEMRFLFYNNPECRDSGLKMVKEVENMLSDIRMVPAEELLGGFNRLVRDMGKKAGKAIDFRIEGGDIPLDRRIVQILIEPLTHLIRNSIDHGIEFASERSKLGKPGSGLIELKIDRAGRDVLIILSDDGRGIKKDDILARADEMGIKKEEERELLHYLIQPGFSTIKEATPLSGRGMGLDLIHRAVKQNAGGTVTLLTREAEGTSFILRIPRNFNPMKIVLFRSGGVFAVSTRQTVETMEVEGEDFKKNSSGGLFLEGLPVYSVHGRMFMTGQPPREKTALKVTHMGSEAWLLIKELLFEQNLPEEQFKLGKEISPHHFEVMTGGRKADYIYLNPSLFVT